MPSVVHTALGTTQSEAEVLDWVHRTLGPVEKVQELSSGTHKSVQLETKPGDHVVVKWFSQSQPFHRSVEALGVYCQALGAQAPKLIDQSENLRAVLMTMVTGLPPSANHVLDFDAHRQLGELTRLFHESAAPRRSSQWASAVAGEISWLAEATELTLDPEVLRVARVTAMELLDLGAIDLVPIHGGLVPGHWLIDHVLGPQLVGFSGSDYAPSVVDTLPLDQELWGYSPLLADAFFAGYGRVPDATDRTILRAMTVKSALEGWQRVHTQRVTKAARTEAISQLDRAFGATLF